MWIASSRHTIPTNREQNIPQWLACHDTAKLLVSWNSKIQVFCTLFNLYKKSLHLLNNRFKLFLDACYNVSYAQCLLLLFFASSNTKRWGDGETNVTQIKSTSSLQYINDNPPRKEQTCVQKWKFIFVEYATSTWVNRSSLLTSRVTGLYWTYQSNVNKNRDMTGQFMDVDSDTSLFQS